MQIFAPLVALAGLASSAQAFAPCSGPNARIQPPVGATVVDASGTHPGSFKTIAEAAAHLPNTTATVEHTLFVYPGVYEEQVTITHAMAQKDVPATVTKNRNDATSTLLLKASDVKIYNLNVANTAGDVGQAIAAKVDGANYGIYACNFTGYQDTLYSNKGPELIAKSYINGAIDFVFGLYAKAWFESCDIEVIGDGCITANGRNNDTNPSEYVFNKANVFGSGKGIGYLGRPWRPYASVVFQNSNISDVINSDGWQKWNGDNNTTNVYFKEFNNTGADPGRQLRVPVVG
ncbi:hypothetical protein PF007_g29368 [Phytophthora fragariae]|uniref:Pectinesterase n=1 Tax=Phytophthora fragariae TaxID=53985 RepID=A0A6A3Q9F0_9STRA|nr:hypothetical protein PF007_g29368 [Phytophthora fragariae]KAE9070955.1 hypothetical protein PF006_g29250 [Phytophthora fragariae]KAE9269271.1 hypothetical protein PF001_g29297 [Phytophthora fragariae]